MKKERILFEHYKLTLDWFQANAAYNYYADMYIRIMEETISNESDKAEKEDFLHLPPTELSKKMIEFKEAYARIEASKELTKQIDRLREKALRKKNEAKQRMDLFCKRHGLERID